MIRWFNKFIINVLIFLFILLIISTSIFAKSKIILDEKKIKINNSKGYKYNVRKIIKIDDEMGKKYSSIIIHENEFYHITDFIAKIYDSKGKLVEKFKERDLKVYEISPGYYLYSKEKYKYINLTNSTLPYKIEIEYSISVASLFFLPNWNPQYSIPVEKSIFTVITPKNYKLKTNNTNLIPKVKISKTKKSKKYEWVLENIQKYENEYRTSPENNNKYLLMLQPEKFIYGKVKGIYDTWSDFGKFYYELAKNQYDLKAKDITDINIPENYSDIEKIKFIYSYIQENTRYVNIDFGIHGWKPHSAKSIFINKYGDCKDLATLFISLLKHEGIEAYPVLILTRDKGFVDPKFVMNSFNHLIAFIPLENDSLWIDCTSDYSTIYDLPRSDEGCNVVIIENEIGKMRMTPLSTAEDNTTIFSANGKLGYDRTLKLNGYIKGKNNYAQKLYGYYRSENDKKRKEILVNWLSDYSSNLVLTSCEFLNFDENEINPIIKFNCISSKYANKGGNRYFLNPSFYHRQNFNGEKPEERTNSIFYLFPRTIIDSIRYELPHNVVVEAIPNSISIDHDFGSFIYNIVEEGKFLLFVRKFQIKKRHIPLDDYKKYFDMMNTVLEFDKKMVVLKIK